MAQITGSLGAQGAFEPLCQFVEANPIYNLIYQEIDPPTPPRSNSLPQSVVEVSRVISK